MHEFGIMTQLLSTVTQQATAAGATRVLAINLVIGERMAIVDESLQLYFDLLSADGLAAGAALRVRHVPTRFYCTTCAEPYAPAVDHFYCPTCGALGQLTADGGECRVESIEIERETPAYVHD